MISLDTEVVRENLGLMAGTEGKSMPASLAGETFWLQPSGLKETLVNFGYDPNTGRMFGFVNAGVINRKIFSTGEFRVQTDGKKYRVARMNLDPATAEEARENMKETVLQYNAVFGF